MSFLLKYFVLFMAAGAATFAAWSILQPLSEWWDRYTD